MSVQNTEAPRPYVCYIQLVVDINQLYLLHIACIVKQLCTIRHFSLLNVNAAGACGYDFPCDGGRLVRAYLRRRRGTI